MGWPRGKVRFRRDRLTFFPSCPPPPRAVRRHGKEENQRRKASSYESLTITLGTEDAGPGFPSFILRPRSVSRLGKIKFAPARRWGRHLEPFLESLIPRSLDCAPLETSTSTFSANCAPDHSLYPPEPDPTRFHFPYLSFYCLVYPQATSRETKTERRSRSRSQSSPRTLLSRSRNLSRRKGWENSITRRRVLFFLRDKHVST